MKKYFIIGALTASMIVPLLTGATSVVDLQALINSLMAQVAQLQAQLLAQQGGGGVAWCYTFNKNLGMRDRGNEVRALQQALIKEGFTVDEKDGETLATYKDATAAAVTGFQQKYKDEILTPNGLAYGTGYVGPATRKKLNQLYECGGGGEVLNKPPVITGVSGPTTIAVNQQGTWSVNAYDPENGILSYDFAWGDGVSGMPGGFGQMYDRTTSQQAAMTHSYSLAGTYKIVIAVSDNSGKSTQSSITVNVGGTTTSSISVLSPNGGEVWQKGTTQVIKWQDNTPVSACPVGAQCSPAAPKSYDIKLVPDYPPCTGSICPMTPVFPPYIIMNGVYGSNYYWPVGDVRYMGALGNGVVTAPDGAYTVQVCVSGTNVCDSSDSYFKIVSGVSSVSEQVKCVFNNSTTEQQCYSYSTDGQYKFSGIGTAGGVVTGTLGTQITWKSSCGGYAYTIIDGQNEYANFYCGSIIQPSITVLSPNGGETWTKGTTQDIKWWGNVPIPSPCPVGAYCASSAPKFYDIKLIPDYPPCTGNICPMMPYIAPYVIYSNVNDTSFPWTVGKVINPSVTYIPDGSYTVQVCVSGTNVCDSSDSYFKIVSSGVTTLSVKIKNVTSGKCLDIRSSDEYVVQNSCNSSIATQNWKFENSGSAYQIRNAATGKCIDIRSAAYTNQTPLISFGCHGGINQQWTLRNASDISQIISSQIISVAAPSLGFDIPNAATADGVQVQLYSAHGGGNQLFTFYNLPQQQPSITVLSPNGGEVLTLGSTQTIRWSPLKFSVSTAQVTISLVDADGYSDERWLGNVGNQDSSFNWYIPNCTASNPCSSNFQISTGKYKIKVSGSGSSDSSDAPFSIVSTTTDNQPPTVSILTVPVVNSGTSYTTGQTFKIVANASDNPGGSGIAKVEFYGGGGAVLLGTDTQAPYEYNWTIDSGTARGIHSLLAIAYDNAGNQSRLSNNITVSVGGSTIQPSITSIYPTSGSANETITIYGKNLVDTIPSGVNVEFMRNGIVVGSNGISNVSSQPGGLALNFKLNPLFVANSQSGLYQIRVSNDNGYSNATNFSISATTDTQPPTVSILTVPVVNSGTSYITGQTFKIVANASDNPGGSGIAKVEFYGGGGGVLLGTATTTPFSYTWNINASTARGIHSLLAIAYDNAGNQSRLSNNITVNVNIPISATLSVASTTLNITGLVTTPWPPVGGLVINGGNQPYKMTIVNTGSSTRFGITIESSIEQGTSTKRQARESLLPTCFVNGAVSVSGSVPPGVCTAASYIFANDNANNPGFGRFYQGGATMVLELKQNGVLLSRFTTPITLVATAMGMEYSPNTSGIASGAATDADIQSFSNTLANLRAILLNMLESIR